jgi:hypothetical protein
MGHHTLSQCHQWRVRSTLRRFRHATFLSCNLHQYCSTFSFDILDERVCRSFIDIETTCVLALFRRYALIMPTIVRIYSNIQSNVMVKKAIEYCCRQMFVLHRLPFVLQMLGSVAQWLDTDEQADVTDTNKIQSKYLFRLLIALERIDADERHDDYFIMELIRHDSMPAGPSTSTSTADRHGNVSTTKVMKSVDFCYANDDSTFTFLHCLDVCISVGKCSQDIDTIVCRRSCDALHVDVF